VPTLCNRLRQLRTRIENKGAQELGIPNDTINEAVWLAVAFGGSPVLMFYRKLGLTGL